MKNIQKTAQEAEKVSKKGAEKVLYKKEIEELDEKIEKIKANIKRCNNGTAKDNLRKKLSAYEGMREDLNFQQRHLADKETETD